MAKYSVGIIACGSIARAHARGWQATPDVEIVAVADTYDAILSDRPYRRAAGADQAAAELRRMAGKQFDPRIVSAFLDAGIEKRVRQVQSADRMVFPIVEQMSGPRGAAPDIL